ncbi:MAG: DHA2 family efflux MFS transporter permease subunit [Pseudomonadales bacterium]|nr:DHA2 family efflux MFS transporter permease subunit [Pseudomonadales bacterium]
MTDTNANVAVTPDSDAVSLGTWITVFGGVLGAFIAVLNIHITNASLKDIQGALSATLEEGSFISTAYLTTEIIVIPITGWIASVLGLRRYILWNVALFMIATLSCAIAWNLESMLVFRALAGLFGGALIPLSFTIILTLLPPSKQAIGMGLFALTATQAPTIGPTLGGYLSENFGWQTIFYLQIIPTSIMFIILWRGLTPTKPQLHLLKNGDWYGILAMAVGLGAMEIVLEEGNRKDWFESDFIVRGTILAVFALGAFIYIELRHKNPFINLRLMTRRNFGLANGVNVLLGLGLYGSVFVMPLYLTQVQGYNAMQIGQVMMWVGLPQLIVVPIVLRLMKVVDLRILLAIGATIFGLSCLLNIHMSADYGYDHILLPHVIRGIGMPFMMVPLSVIATAGIEQEQVGSASGLFNVMRNLGGSVGIAMLATFLSLREQFHSNHILESVSLYAPATVERLQQLEAYFSNLGADSVLAHEQALRAIDAVARRESTILAFNDAFYVIGSGFAISLVFIALMKKPQIEPS